MFRKSIIAVFISGIAIAAIVPAHAVTVRIDPATPALGASAVNYHAKKYSQQHYDWCSWKYKSYDPYTNTYQPHYGPRRQCVSPYS